MKYTIERWALERLKAKVEKLSARALKLKFAPIELIVNRTWMPLSGGYTTGPEGQIIGPLPPTEMADIEITGTSPKINGWSLVAFLEHTEEGNIFNTINSEVDSSAYKKSEADCDHCKINRRRLNTYILQNEEGVLKQVGKTCLKDFLGHNSIDELVSLAQTIAEINEEEREERTRMAGVYTPKEFLRIVCDYLLLPKIVYVSNTKARENGSISTCDAIQLTLEEGNQILLTDKGEKIYNTVCKWVENLDVNGNEFYSNLSVIYNLDLLQRQHYGYIAAVPSCYDRYLEEIERNKVDLARGHVGTIGKREDFEVTFLRRNSFETQWGVTIVDTMIDENGNYIVWKGAGLDADIGDKLKIKATVKDHSEYRGVKQTYVSRVTDVGAAEEMKKKKSRVEKAR